MNREEVEVEDEKGKIKKVPHPDSVAAWAKQQRGQPDRRRSPAR